MRLAWTDDFGFASSYAVEESPRVIARIREAAFGLTGIGAAVEQTEERWEDYTAALNVHRCVHSDMPVYGPEAGVAVSEKDWGAATELRQRFWHSFHTLFEQYDLLLCPTQQSLPPTFDTWRTWWTGPTSMADGVLGLDGYAIHTALFNWLRFPAASVPCGFVDGLPVGLQIVGPPGSDARVLRLAHAFRQTFPHDEHPPVS